MLWENFLFCNLFFCSFDYGLQLVFQALAGTYYIPLSEVRGQKTHRNYLTQKLGILVLIFLQINEISPGAKLVDMNHVLMSFFSSPFIA